MITKARAYKASDGKTYATTEAAKRAEIRFLCGLQPDATDIPLDKLVTQAPQVIAVLKIGLPRKKRGSKAQVAPVAPVINKPTTNPEDFA